MNAIFALSVFIITYGFIAAEKFNRVAIALVGAAAMVIVGATDADAAFFSHDTGIGWFSKNSWNSYFFLAIC